MRIGEFFRSILKTGKEIRTDTFSLDKDTESVALEMNLTEYGVFTVIGYIATLNRQAQWYTYKDGKRFKGYEWYAWNVRPNPNQSAAEFWDEFYSRLMLFGEVLIFSHNGGRYIADNSFYADYGNGVQPALYTDVGRDIFRFSRPLRPSEVLHFRYGNRNARNAVMGLCDLYGKLIASASENYQKEGNIKAVLNIDAHQQGTDKEQAAEMKIVQERFAAFFKGKNSVLPLKKGFEYRDVTPTGVSGRGVSDITALRADALKSACEAFQLPYGLVSGEVAGTADAWELATATVLNPFRQIIETELNGKLYKVSDILNGTCIKGDVSRIKPINIFEKADNIYKLIGCGYTHNELRERTGDDIVDDPEANKRFFTKNNSEMTGGGENNETDNV